MRTHTIPLLACLGIALAPRSAHAAPIETSCYKPATYVVFANGMNTTLADAIIGREAIESAMDQAMLVQSDYRFDLAYNFKEEPWREVLQAVDQRDAQEFILTWLEAADQAPPTDPRVKIFADWARAYNNVLLNKDADLTKHVAMYRKMSAQGGRIAILCHSQGNFYTNMAYDLLNDPVRPIIPLGTMGVISVANPAPRVAGDSFCSLGNSFDCANKGRYTTFNKDVIIAGVRFFYPTTLAANVNVEPAYEGAIDRLGHALLKSYLFQPSTRTRILQQIDDTIKGLKRPPPAPPALVTADLQWDTADSDLDIHGYEPGGLHVYWNNPTPSSFVTDDATAGSDAGGDEGQESYVVGCDQVREGRYQIGGNFYDGTSSDQRANLNIYLGDPPTLVRTIEATFSHSSGGIAGDAQPQMIATIDIAADRVTPNTYTMTATPIAVSKAGPDPINSQYAGQQYPLSAELAQKYPSGILFTDDGYPDFSPYALETAVIDVQCDRVRDNAAANLFVHQNDPSFFGAPDGYVWHHHQDGSTMQLVPIDLHDAVRHSGPLQKGSLGTAQAGWGCGGD